VIVIENVKHLAAKRLPQQIEVPHARQFAADAVDVDPDRAVAALHVLASRFKNPPTTAEAVLSDLVRRYGMVEVGETLTPALLLTAGGSAVPARGSGAGDDAPGRAEVNAMIDYAGDIGRALTRADPEKLEELYRTLRLEVIYYPEERAADVTIRPGRGSERVRGGLDHYVHGLHQQVRLTTGC
jgi:hypothetical protein